MSYLPVGGCPTILSSDYLSRTYTNEEIRQLGLSGKAPGCQSTFNNTMRDPAKKKIFLDAQKSAATIAEAKTSTDVAKATSEAIRTGRTTAADVAAVAANSSMKTYLLVGGGLAALAVVLVVLKKKRGASAKGPA